MLTVNNEYLLSPYVLDDGNVLTIRAIETETVQTSPIYFHLHPIADPGITLSLLQFNETQRNDLRELIKPMLLNEIYKTNIDLTTYGISLVLDLEILFPYEQTTVISVPSITDYSTMFTAETNRYLKDLEIIYTETLNRKTYIDSAMLGIFSSVFSEKLDVVTALGHSNLVLPELSNKNMLKTIPNEWLSLHLGSGGAKITDVGLRLGNTVNDSGYIKVGFQPSAESFNIYFPNQKFTKDSCSFSVSIEEAEGSGIIYHRGDYQDMLYWNDDLSRFEFNIHGNPEEGHLATFDYTGNLDGIWTVNRINSTTIQLWKNNVYYGDFASLSHDSIIDYNYGSLGWSGRTKTALKAIYKFVCVGGKLVQEDLDTIALGIEYYTSQMPANS